MTDRSTTRDIALILMITAALGSVLFSLSKSELILIMGPPAALVGIVALIFAVVCGASRWWLSLLPVVGWPLILLGLLWSACKFGGDCL